MAKKTEKKEEAKGYYLGWRQCVWDVRDRNGEQCWAEYRDETSVLGECFYRQCFNSIDPASGSHFCRPHEIKRQLNWPVFLWPARRLHIDPSLIHAVPIGDPGERVINLMILNRIRPRLFHDTIVLPFQNVWIQIDAYMTRLYDEQKRKRIEITALEKEIELLKAQLRKCLENRGNAEDSQTIALLQQRLADLLAQLTRERLLVETRQIEYDKQMRRFIELQRALEEISKKKDQMSEWVEVIGPTREVLFRAQELLASLRLLSS